MSDEVIRRLVNIGTPNPRTYSSSIFVMCLPGITMSPIRRLVILTLTVALLFSEVLSHDSASFAAAASMAEGVGKRYSRELARMTFRSCNVNNISTARKPRGIRLGSRGRGFSKLSQGIAHRIGAFEDAHEHATVRSVYAQLATKKPIQVLNSLFSVHGRGPVIGMGGSGPMVITTEDQK